MKIPLDIIGDIVLFKFPREATKKSKTTYAKNFLKTNKHVVTALEKVGKISGRLRTPETKFLAGINKRETTCRENDCSIMLDIDKTYFSPRLSTERKIVAEDILRNMKTKPKILVMFAGVAPQPVVLAKILKKNNKKAEIISSEINRIASMYAEKNVQINKLQDYIQVVQGDSRKLCEKLAKKEKFDFILMLRPNLKNTFLREALKVAKKGTIFYYHGFGEQEDIIKKIDQDIKKSKRKYKVLEIRKAGDIGVRKYRFNIKFIVY
jgi:tRNA (guanine37-N1)-methyltransferase